MCINFRTGGEQLMQSLSGSILIHMIHNSTHRRYDCLDVMKSCMHFRKGIGVRIEATTLAKMEALNSALMIVVFF